MNSVGIDVSLVGFDARNLEVGGPPGRLEVGTQWGARAPAALS